MSGPSAAAVRAAQEAAEWLVTMDETDPVQADAFARWLARSPLHLAAFCRVAVIAALAEQAGLSAPRAELSHPRDTDRET